MCYLLLAYLKFVVFFVCFIAAIPQRFHRVWEWHPAKPVRWHRAASARNGPRVYSCCWNTHSKTSICWWARLHILLGHRAEYSEYTTACLRNQLNHIFRLSKQARYILYTVIGYGPDYKGVDSGDTAWMLTASALAFIMTTGIAFFYCGMVSA